MWVKRVLAGSLVLSVVGCVPPVNDSPVQSFSALERPARFFIQKWRVMPGRLLTRDMKSAQATASLEACLSDSVNESPLLVQTKVRLALAEEPALPADAELVEADYSGCVRSTRLSPVSFPYFGAEQYLKRYLVVQPADGPFAGVTRAVPVALNPWQKGEPLFSWDLQRGPAPLNPDPRPASLQVEELHSQYPPQKDDVALDAHLNLTTKEVFYLTLKPTVHRPYTFNDGHGGPTNLMESVWPGMRFRVRAVFTGTHIPSYLDRERFSALRLLNGFETTVTADDRGMLVFPVALAYDFLERPLLESSVRLFLEVRPDGADVPTALTLEAFFDPYADALSSVPVLMSRDRFDDIVTALLPRELGTRDLLLSEEKLSALTLHPENYRLWKPGSASIESPLALFRKRVGLPKNLVQPGEGDPWPAELTAVGFSPADFDRLTKGQGFDRPALHKLCRLYFTPGPRTSHEACLRQPDHYLRLLRLAFVEELKSTPRKIPGPLTSLQVSAVFSQEKSDAVVVHRGHQQSHEVDVGVEATAGYSTFGNGVVAKASYSFKNEWFVEKERAIGRGQKDQFVVQEVRSLVADETQIEMDAKTKRCLFFRHRPWMRTGLTAAATEERGYFLCKTEEGPVRESWYYVTDAEPGLARRDVRDLRKRQWLIQLRGRDAFVRFKARVEDRLGRIDLIRVPVFDRGVDHLMNDIYRRHDSPFGLFKDGGVFPGMTEESGF